MTFIAKLLVLLMTLGLVACSQQPAQPEAPPPETWKEVTITIPPAPKPEPLVPRQPDKPLK